jgi:hypothetical protein
MSERTYGNYYGTECYKLPVKTLYTNSKYDHQAKWDPNLVFEGSIEIDIDIVPTDNKYHHKAFPVLRCKTCYRNNKHCLVLRRTPLIFSDCVRYVQRFVEAAKPVNNRDFSHIDIDEFNRKFDSELALSNSYTDKITAGFGSL